MDINPSGCINIDFIDFSLRHLTFIAVLKPLDVPFLQIMLPAHDSFIRLLQRQPPDTKARWGEVKSHFKLKVMSSLRKVI